jgi:hypothetical protein
MQEDRDLELKRAAELWNGGQALEAGKIIFDSLPIHAQPGWAAGILRLVLQQSGVQLKQIDRVLRIADRPEEWKKAHDAFSWVREQTLKLDKEREHGSTDEQKILGGVLSLAELVAKVTYNATEPDDGFDEDSGWRIASNLRAAVNWWKDEDFTQAAWSALASEPSGNFKAD